jgi:hypothetical protein
MLMLNPSKDPSSVRIGEPWEFLSVHLPFDLGVRVVSPVDLL